MHRFAPAIAEVQREIAADALRLYVERLQPFGRALDDWLGALFSGPLPDDWRQRYHAFLVQQETNGFFVTAESASELETWIEAWAQYCRLLPEGLPGFVDRPPADVQTLAASAQIAKQQEEGTLTFQTTHGWFVVYGKLAEADVRAALMLAATLIVKEAELAAVREAIAKLDSVLSHIARFTRLWILDFDYQARQQRALLKRQATLTTELDAARKQFVDRGYGNTRWEGYFGSDRAWFGGRGLDGAIAILNGTQYTGGLRNVTIEELMIALTAASLARFAATLGLRLISRALVQSYWEVNVYIGPLAMGRRFAGEAGELLKKVTEVELRRLAKTPGRARATLRPGEGNLPVNPDTVHGAFGRAIERLVGEQIERDARLSQLLEYTGRISGPDFRGIGRYEGLIFDITTPGQVLKHLNRPYGDSLIIITYHMKPL